MRSPEDGGGSAPASTGGAAGGGGGESTPGGTASPSSTSSAPASSGTPSPSIPEGGTRVSGEVRDDRPSPNFDFAGLGLDEIDIPLETDTGPGLGKAAQEGKEGQPAAPAAKAPEAAPPKQEATQPAPETKDQGAPVPAADPSSPESILRGLEHAETATAIKGWLAQNMYQLSEAEKQALDTDAVGAIPGLLSRVHFEMSKNVISQINALVPKLVESGVQRILQGKERGQSAMNEFFSAWPGLNPKEHGGLVNQFATMYRQSNPKASRADAIKFVGAAIHAHLGILPQQAKPNGSAPPRVQPFAPARPGARTVSSPQVVDQWAGLGVDHDEE